VIIHRFLRLFDSRFKKVKCQRKPEITLLAMYCPLFWIALLSEAETSGIIFHAIHSGIVFLIGISIMAVGYFNEIKKVNDG